MRRKARGNSRSEKSLSRKVSCLALGAMLLALSFSAEAQQPAKIPRIGYLTGATPDGQSARIEAFRLGLRELGYVEGKNIVIEWGVLTQSSC
jgi:putative ABC transport system substrate-binding protein